MEPNLLWVKCFDCGIENIFQRYERAEFYKALHENVSGHKDIKVKQIKDSDTYETLQKARL